MNVVPTQFTGCWKRTSSGNGVSYIKIEENGSHYVSDGKTPFAVSADGTTLDWSGTVYARRYGTGQTIVGVWDLGTEEYYFRPEGTFTYHDAGYELPGLYDTFGDTSGGSLAAWEKRAIITSVADIGDGSFAVSATSLSGGISTYAMRIDGTKLIFVTDTGQTTEFAPIDCTTL